MKIETEAYLLQLRIRLHGEYQRWAWAMRGNKERRTGEAFPQQPSQRLPLGKFLSVLLGGLGGAAAAPERKMANETPHTHRGC